MKILAIRLCNLNSLLGSWTIDFSAPEYSAAGLFAITGPTGAGKSTILDALCLALFGRTPRLGPITKGSNEILSRRAGHCSAEVEFETGRGRFRCHWGQHRARHSPAGELQTPRHEIAELDSGRILAERSREVVRQVEEVTGMDYDRFTRSILLAQGGFAAFLEADGDQRAPILEQITGTAIYSRVSSAVHERTSAERRLTEEARAAFSGISLLGEEELAELDERIRTAELAAAVQQEQLERVGGELQRLARITTLRGQLESLAGERERLAARRQAAGGDLARYARGINAQGFAGEAARLGELRHRLAQLNTHIARLGNEMDACRKEHQQAAADHGRVEQRCRACAASLAAESEPIKTARALDLLCREKQSGLNQAEAGLEKNKAELDGLGLQAAELAMQLAGTDQQLGQLAEYLSLHAEDGLLVEELAGIREQLLRLQERETALTRIEASLAERRVELGRIDKETAQLQQAEQAAKADAAASRDQEQGLSARRHALLDGQEPAAVRGALEELGERLRRLEQTGELLTRQERASVLLAQTRQAALELAERRQQTLLLRQNLTEQLRLATALTRTQEELHRQSLRIHSYEEERHRLKDGDPCPLCGALDHPWADSGPPPADAEAELVRLQAELARLVGEEQALAGELIGLERDLSHAGETERRIREDMADTERQLAQLLPLLDGSADREAEAVRQLALVRQQAEALRERLAGVDQVEDELAAARRRVEETGQHLTGLRSRLQAVGLRGEGLVREIGRLELEIEGLRTCIGAERAALLGRLQPLGISQWPVGQNDALLARLEERLKQWKAQRMRHEELHRQRSALLAEGERLKLLRAALETGRAQQLAERDRLQGEYHGLVQQRKVCFGDRDPDQEELRLGRELSAAQAEEAACRARLVELERRLHGQGEQSSQACGEVDRLAPQVEELEQSLLGRLPAAGLSDLDDLRQALLPPEELAGLARLKEGLDRDEAGLAGRASELAAALAGEEEQHRGRPGQEVLAAEEQARRRNFGELQQRLGADRERLAANERQEERHARHREVLAARERELARWELLHRLIGSADGKKFRLFAQGLTFEILVSHANRQLAKMSDRYILLTDQDLPLALQVIDTYQAGETRSTRNLSGGESFLVSLALALGLSAMASRRVRVDSLFLDEGFGTLDEEALDIALQTLAELNQDGKLIGIISHVALLKERIDVRIQVVPGPGGNSRLIGPGCSRS